MINKIISIELGELGAQTGKFGFVGMQEKAVITKIKV
jgi:hypothetical protein